jgi:hypothetical protein
VHLTDGLTPIATRLIAFLAVRHATISVRDETFRTVGDAVAINGLKAVFANRHATVLSLSEAIRAVGNLWRCENDVGNSHRK